MFLSKKKFLKPLENLVFLKYLTLLAKWHTKHNIYVNILIIRVIKVYIIMIS